jgi:Ca2+-binding RTX toxin-like protein
MSDDFLFFQGAVQPFSVTLVNPYTGETIVVEDEDRNVNTGVYHGGDGFDTLVFSSLGDVLFIADQNGNQVVTGVERFVGSAGDDIIILSDPNIEYGNVEIFGNTGNDIIWSNNGNDLIRGDGGDDQINGGGGNDNLSGGNDNDIVRGAHGDDQVNGDAGNDILYGGLGHDVVRGGAGDDILYGGDGNPAIVIDKDFADDVIFPELMERVNIANLDPPGTNALGVNDGNFTLDVMSQATITFREGFAGYNNTLGVYRINADGTISDVQILFTNVKDAGINQSHTINLPVGQDGGEFAFFIIANGDNVNNNYSAMPEIGDEGVLRFVYDYGLSTERDAAINDNASRVTLVYDDGQIVRVINGPDYHTTIRGESTALNHDGQIHAVTGLLGEGENEVLRVGFEDLPNLGDADYEDVLFDLDIIEQTVDVSEAGFDTLIGGAGNDTFYGEAGDDLLIVGEGADHIYGGAGSDTILYDFFDTAVDTIYGFELGENGDVLDISGILEGYDPLEDLISDFMRFTEENGVTALQVNIDGQGDDFVTIALFDANLNIGTPSAMALFAAHADDSISVKNLLHDGNLLLA